MPEPTSTATATLIATGASIPVLTAFGVPLGLRADVLLAGLLGAIVAIILLNTVPSKGDTWRNLIDTTMRRTSVAVASAAVSGYIVPAMLESHKLEVFLATAFIVGAGAQKVLAMLVERLVSKKPEASS